MRFKPATETSQKIEISLVANLDMILSSKPINNNGADQTAQMRRLICAFVVGKPTETCFLTLRPKLSLSFGSFFMAESNHM